MKEKIINLLGLKGDSRTSIVKKNIYGSFLVRVISIAISMILIPLTIGYVNSELYGIWLTLATVISWMGLFDLGFGHGLRNKLAENIALGDWEKARKYVSTAYVSFTILFLPVCIVAFILCPYVNWTNLLNVADDYQEILVKTMQVLIVFFFLESIIKTQGSVLQALQLTALHSAFGAVGQTLTLIVTAILTVTTKPSLIYLVFAVSGCPLLVYYIVSLWLYGIKYKQLRPSIRLVDKSLVKDVFSLGIYFFFLQIAALVLYQTTNIIISNVSGPEFVTEYNVVYKYLSLPFMATTIISSPFWTAFTDAYTLRDYGWMKRAHVKLLQIFMSLFAFLILLICIYPIFFDLWLGDKVEIHFNMIIVCAVYVAIMMWNSLHSTLLNGMGLIKLQLYNSILGTILCIPLALFLGRQVGAIGVVLSISILSLPGVFLLYIQVKKLINNSATGIWSH